jgi:transcriptional regulator with XRE-family HTH domain
MPRQHSHPSTVATLRKLIAQHRGRPFTQADLARRSGAARITIQSIERGVLALSEQLARRIAEATGAGAEWLLRGKPSSQPKDAHGRLLTREIWLAHESDLPKRHGSPEQGHSRQARHRVAVNVSAFLPALASVAASAAKQQRLDLFAADLRETVNKFAARYGKDDRTFADVQKKAVGVRIAEPGFPATLPPDRFCRVRLDVFGESSVNKGQEIDFAAALNDPAVYAVTVEVKPSATAQEIRALYPRPKVKAAKKAAKGRKKTA